MYRVAARKIPPASFTVTNLSAKNYREVEIRLRFVGAVGIVQQTSDTLPTWPLISDIMPRPPHEQESALIQAMRGLRGSYMPHIDADAIPPSDAATDGEPPSITLPLLDLRPGVSEELRNDWVVLVPHGSDLRVQWSATAVNVDGQATGTIRVDSPAPVDLVPRMEENLATGW